MKNQTVRTAKKENKQLFFYLCCLTVFFLLLEISFFIQSNKAYFVNFSLISGTLNFPLKILPEIFYFLVIQIGLHLLFCWLTWLITIEVNKWLKVKNDQVLWLAISVWLCSIVTVLILNQHYYPNSKYAEFFNFVSSNILLSYAFLGFAFSWIIFSLLILISMLWRAKIILISSTCLAIFSFSYLSLTQSKPLAVATDRTNIIIIGIDSLRPDFVGYFGGTTTTPYLDNFLQEAAYFTEAMTPLARTFPSWVSILTGRHPKEVSVRFNLARTNLFQIPTLADQFRSHGYLTMYATDETRFSNIDESFGFDKIVSPPMGLNDFLIGSFNDFPISNLLINTAVGEWLFPFNYGNRGVYFSYDPASFLNKLQGSLAREQKPLFLAVHFCLPHFPFMWREQRLSHENILLQYQASISEVDKQIKQLLDYLAQKKILDNAIVVLLSDHGEGLELAGDRVTDEDLFVSELGQKPLKFYPAMLDNEAMNRSAGHGTDVLGLSQYHTLLAFRTYGKTTPFVQGALPGVVSLIDIKPTLVDWVLKDQPGHSQNSSVGQSLLPSLINGKRVTSRHFFLESDFSPAAMRTLFPQIESVLLEGISLFQVDPKTARLIVKADMGDKIIKTKQYADLYGHWILAYYPQSDNKHRAILVNLQTGQWSDDWSSSFVRHSPAQAMAKALKDFYGDEIRN